MTRRRPITIEHRAPDPAEARRRRACEQYADAALARACTDHPDMLRDVVAGIFMRRAANLARYAVDGARAQSLLGVASGRVEGFEPVRGVSSLADVTFRRRA